MPIQIFQTKTFLFVSAVFIFLFSCSKRSSPDFVPNGPPPSKPLTGIFLCKVNDSPWIADKQSPGVHANISGDSLSIIATATGRDGHTEQIALYLRKHYQPTLKEYLLNDSMFQFARYQTSSASPCFIPNIQGSTNSAYRKSSGGNLRLTTANDTLIKGTFYFDIPADHCDTLRISNGVFEIHLR